MRQSHGAPATVAKCQWGAAKNHLGRAALAVLGLKTYHGGENRGDINLFLEDAKIESWEICGFHTSPQNFISNIETYIDSVDVITLLCPRQSDEVIQPC